MQAGSRTRLLLPRAVALRLEADARTAAGLEVCGLLAGHADQVTRCYPARNVAAEPARRFEMDPHAQIAAMRDMRERDLDLLAVYHSHPDGTTRPSATDLALHAYPDALCVILARTASGSVTLHAHALDHSGFREVAVVVGDETEDMSDRVDSYTRDSGQ